MKHLMIDLETLSGSNPNAAFFAVGWCTFDENDIINNGTIYVNCQETMNLGMDVDWETIKWWVRQSDMARSVMVRDSEYSLGEAFHSLEYAYLDCSAVWANPANFDLAILDRAAYLSKRRLPWGWRDTRCLKTLCGDRYAELKKQFFVEGLEHVPAEDAMAQVKIVQEVWREHSS